MSSPKLILKRKPVTGVDSHSKRRCPENASSSGTFGCGWWVWWSGVGEEVTVSSAIFFPLYHAHLRAENGWFLGKAVIISENISLKANKIKSPYLNFCNILSSSCNTQYLHTTEHTYARLTFVVSLVDNEFSSKCCCVGLITTTNSLLSYHRH